MKIIEEVSVERSWDQNVEVVYMEVKTKLDDLEKMQKVRKLSLDGFPYLEVWEEL